MDKPLVSICINHHNYGKYLARPAIGWLFAPQSRPRLIQKLRSLVNSEAQPA